MKLLYNIKTMTVMLVQSTACSDAISFTVARVTRGYRVCVWGGCSLNFALCVEACSHQYNPDVELLHYHQDLTSFICSSFQLQSTPLPTIPNPGQSLISSPSLSFCYFRNVYTDRIIQDMSFWDWLFSVNGMSMKFIQVFKYISSLCYLLIVAFNCMNIP